MSDDHQELVDAYFEGAATPEQVAELDRALLEDEDLRVQFLESASLIAELSQAVGEGGIGNEAEAPIPVTPFPWRRLAAAAGLVLALGVTLFSLFNRPADGGPNSLVLIEGGAQFGGVELEVGDRCDPPGQLAVRGHPQAVFRYPDGTTLTMEEGAGMRIDEGANKALFLESGSLLADVRPQSAGAELVMETARSTFTVLGTRYRLSTNETEDVLEVEHGAVRVMEKASGEERIVKQGARHQVTGSAKPNPDLRMNIYPPGHGGRKLPAASHRTTRWLFTEDVEPTWIIGIWEVKAPGSPDYEPLRDPVPSATMEQAIDRKGKPTTVIKLSRPPGAPAPVLMRLRKDVEWDLFQLQYYHRSPPGDPADLAPLCLDLPEGVKEEEVFARGGPEPLKGEDEWNFVRLEYLRYWDGKQWAVEVRRYLNGEHRSSTRIDIERAPPIQFELRSGTVLLDWISVGEMEPVDKEE